MANLEKGKSMLVRMTVLLAGLVLFNTARADVECFLKRGTPTTLYIPSDTIYISADAAVDSATVIKGYKSNTLTANVGYNNCKNGTEFGKRPDNLGTQNTSTRIYQTNLSGIGIKLLYNNGVGDGQFPSTSTVYFPNGSTYGTVDVPAGSYYRVEFYKTSALNLQNHDGDLVLPGGKIAYNYLMTNLGKTEILMLNIGQIKIVSTPVCTTSSPLEVNFNDVTPALLRTGVKRDMNFNIVCKTDYGTYSAKASITTTTPASDGNSIRVTDAEGNTDRLAIKITDSNGNDMKVDGSTGEKKASIVSQSSAEYKWYAKLVAGSNSSGPAKGTFNAKAEIVFDID